MPTPPVTLTEVKTFLGNIETPDFDSQLEEFLDAATLAVEHRVGPMVTTSFTESVRLSNCMAMLEHWPVQSITTVDGEAFTVEEDLSDLSIGELYVGTSGRATVAYTAGRAAGPTDVPEDLRIATMVVVGHLWDTQRGRSGGFAHIPGMDDDAPIGGDASYFVMQGFAMPRRAMELMRPYWKTNLR